MNIKIRHERPEDYRRAEEVARDAFYNLYFPGAAEHLTVHKMRDDKDFIEELSYIIEVDGEIAGGIYYTHSKIIGWDGRETKTVSFGPVFIDPKYHRMGLGRRLISHSIEKAREAGHRAIMTLGYPYHYEPYGFLGGKKYNIAMEDGKFYMGLLVLPLYEGALDGISGYIHLTEVLNGFSEEELEAFDATFPEKEKRVQESQREFEIAVVTLDEKEY